MFQSIISTKNCRVLYVEIILVIGCVCVLMADKAPETSVTVMNVHFNVYFTVFVGARETGRERDVLLIGLEAVLKRHWDTTREWEREREGTNAVYTLAQLPEITASPILPDWNRGEWNERMARTQKMKRTLHCILLGNDLWWINRNRRRGWEREGERGEGGGGESLASSEVAPVEPVHAAACMCVWESEWVHECWHVDL